jgi:hypothetical protein
MAWATGPWLAASMAAMLPGSGALAGVVRRAGLGVTGVADSGSTGAVSARRRLRGFGVVSAMVTVD